MTFETGRLAAQAAGACTVSCGSTQVLATVSLVQDDGLSFSVEIGQTVVARAHLHAAANFTSYKYTPPNVVDGTAGSDDGESEEAGQQAPATSFEITLTLLRLGVLFILCKAIGRW